jgi:Fe-S cluster biogenesis protein NfuA/nitrite reductase/ring-hydroxylating ferredoxin subunit
VTGEELNARIERLSAELERIEDPRARRVAEQLTGAILELHGEGLARVMDALADDDEARERVVSDGVVASLLLIHGLYPVELETRVREGLASVRPYMESHGGNVELLAIEDGVARLRLEGSCDGCAASASTLELAIKQALEETAPDLVGLEVEGVVDERPPITGTPLPLATAAPFWQTLADPGVAPGELVAIQADGTHLVVANVDGSLLAYLDRCAACGESLADGELSDGVLRCAACERGFFLPRAGRSLDDDRLQLDPVPLLADGGAGVKVALPA